MLSRALIIVALLAVAAAALFVIREQRDANRAILSTLNTATSALEQQTQRSRALEQQVVALADRVSSLEREVVDLRRRVVTLSRRAAEVASVRLPDPIEAVALGAPSEFAAPIAAHPAVIDTIPITWSQDWTAYQPAGLIAPAAPIVLDRKLADPKFLKKMYVTYAALQASDVITTTAALRRGGREANPLLRGIAHSPIALVGVKAAAGVGTILLIERLRGDHPVAAAITLVALNATLAAVTVNNVAVTAK